MPRLTEIEDVLHISWSISVYERVRKYDDSSGSEERRGGPAYISTTCQLRYTHLNFALKKLICKLGETRTTTAFRFLYAGPICIVSALVKLSNTVAVLFNIPMCFLMDKLRALILLGIFVDTEENGHFKVAPFRGHSACRYRLLKDALYEMTGSCTASCAGSYSKSCRCIGSCSCAAIVPRCAAIVPPSSVVSTKISDWYRG